MRSRLAESGPTFLDQVRHAATSGELDDTFVEATSARPASSPTAE